MSAVGLGAEREKTGRPPRRALFSASAQQPPGEPPQHLLWDSRPSFDLFLLAYPALFVADPGDGRGATRRGLRAGVRRPLAPPKPRAGERPPAGLGSAAPAPPLGRAPHGARRCPAPPVGDVSPRGTVWLCVFSVRFPSLEFPEVAYSSIRENFTTILLSVF